MLKTTFTAAAAISACSAFAQSSVTVSGVVDVGLSHGSGSVANSNQVTSGNNSTSRLIFRGQEDLGARHFASFWLEGQFGADSGVGASTNTNNQTTGLTPAAGFTWNLFPRLWLIAVRPWAFRCALRQSLPSAAQKDAGSPGSRTKCFRAAQGL